ncbi:fibronectin type III domain-containing protein [Gorillibacterium sp. sgz500922]|uniref:fibronectin type III domain-containing protein n=1 Tax=Gorillibacterium sp. sgz500922 TaxID=3446694 RepID=UPI003F6677B9
MKKRVLLFLLCIMMIAPFTVSAATNSKTTYTYDSSGRLIRQVITNPDQIVLYRYDNKGRLLSKKIDRAYPSTPTASLTSFDAYTFSVSWTSSSDDRGIEGYEYIINPSGRTGLTSPNQTSLKIDGLNADTTYTFQVRSKDIAGRYSPYSTLSIKTWPADPGKPSTPSLTVGIDGSTANLSWTASTDTYGIKEYSILLDGVEIARTANRTYSIPNLIWERTYSVKVLAINIRGAGSDPAVGQIYAIEPGKILYSTSQTLVTWNSTNARIVKYHVKLSWSAPENHIGGYQPSTSIDTMITDKSIEAPTLPYNERGYTTVNGLIEGLDSSGNVIATTGSFSFKIYSAGSPGGVS